MKEAAEYIDEQNKQTLNPRGIMMLDPMEKGLRCVREIHSNDKQIHFLF